MTSDLDLSERRELCDLFDELGPTAPTLCGEWTTADLAAHLLVRERDPRSAPGIIIGGLFEAFTEKLMARQLDQHGYREVVDKVRNGPPMGPLAIPVIRHAMNIVEFFVHHEDVRRANGGSIRTDRPALDAELWTMTKRMLPLMVRKSKVADVRLEIVSTDGQRAAAGKGEVVTLTGATQDLLLKLYGRDSVVDVTYDGAPDAVARVKAGNFGI